MSDRVVISKKTLEWMIDVLELQEVRQMDLVLLDELRAAPEIVSLEGCREAFEKWSESMSPGWGAQLFVRSGDGYKALQTQSDWVVWKAVWNMRLVAPVQSGGVNTTLSKLIDILGWQGGTIHEALSEVLTLVKFHENHHPTCKQSLQVDTATVLVKRLKWYIDELANCLGRTGRHCADMKEADEFHALLTTTQSAREVKS